MDRVFVNLPASTCTRPVSENRPRTRRMHLARKPDSHGIRSATERVPYAAVFISRMRGTSSTIRYLTRTPEMPLESDLCRSVKVKSLVPTVHRSLLTEFQDVFRPMSRWVII